MITFGSCNQSVWVGEDAGTAANLPASHSLPGWRGKLESEVVLLRLGRATQPVWGGLGLSSGMSQVSGSQTWLCLWTLWGSFLNPGQQPPSPQPDSLISCDGWGHKDLLSCLENLPSSEPGEPTQSNMATFNNFVFRKSLLYLEMFPSVLLF